MSEFTENFNTYNTGDLSGQGGWSKSGGLIDVYNGGSYAECKGSIYASHYKKALDPNYNTNTKVFFAANITLTTYTYNGRRYPPFTNIGLTKLPGDDRNVGCVIYILPDGEQVNVYTGDTNNVSDNLGTYTYNINQPTYIEFIHDFATRKFIYVLFHNPDFYVTNKNGSNWGGIPLYWDISINGYYSNYQLWHNIYSRNVVEEKKKYLHYPRWQPTRYGMRPFY